MFNRRNIFEIYQESKGGNFLPKSLGDFLHSAKIQQRSAKSFVLNSPIFFDARDLMADWGWGFTSPQPLPNPLIKSYKR